MGATVGGNGVVELLVHVPHFTGHTPGIPGVAHEALGRLQNAGSAAPLHNV